MSNKRLFVDMDGTLAKFHDEANYLEHMYEEGFFFNLKPFENMVAGINLFREQHPDIDVYIISACVNSPFCAQEKSRWLDANSLSIPEDHRLFTEMGKPKAEYIPGGVTKDDFLLDDYNKGLNQFLFDGGSAIKCHNNINQQGLGAYGGSQGNMWVGPMVHTDDTPAMIAAELAQQMGLEYDLQKVVDSYDNIILDTAGKREVKDKSSIELRGTECVARESATGNFGYYFTNPLNAVRYLSGNEDFLEFGVKKSNGTKVFGPAFQLRAIASNLYGNPDFRSYMKADHSQFAEDVEKAREDAKLPLVGQIQYLYPGGVGEVMNFRDMDAMKAEIEDAENYGRPRNVKWFIEPKVPTLNELTNYFDVEARLFYAHDFEEMEASEVATAITTPPCERTEDQFILLEEAWNAHRDLPGTMQDFMRLTDAEYDELLTTGAVGDRPAEKPPTSLDSMIAGAQNRQGPDNHFVGGKDPQR